MDFIGILDWDRVFRLESVIFNVGEFVMNVEVEGIVCFYVDFFEYDWKVLIFVFYFKKGV